MGRFGCDSLSSAGSRQRVKSLRSSVRLRLVINTARLILYRSVLHCADASFRTHLPRARRKARLFPLVRDSTVESLRSGLCRARYSSGASAYSATGSGFPASHPSPLVLSAFTPSILRLPLRCSSPIRRPDSPAPTAWPSTSIRRFVQALERPFVPRFNLIPSSACRALRACLLTIFASLTSRLSPSRQPVKNSRAQPSTHAPKSVQNRTVLPRSRGWKRRKNICSTRGLRPPHPLCSYFEHHIRLLLPISFVSLC